jgi:hypothetical protein
VTPYIELSPALRTLPFLLSQIKDHTPPLRAREAFFDRQPLEPPILGVQLLLQTHHHLRPFAQTEQLRRARPPQEVKTATLNLLQKADREGVILSLGGGVSPGMPGANSRAMIEAVAEFSSP